MARTLDPVPTPLLCDPRNRPGKHCGAPPNSRSASVFQCERVGRRIGTLKGWRRRSKDEIVGAGWSLGLVGGHRTLGDADSGPMRASACHEGDTTDGRAHEADKKKRH